MYIYNIYTYIILNQNPWKVNNSQKSIHLERRTNQNCGITKILIF